MMRKIAVLCLLLALLAGCGKNEEAPTAFPMQLSELAGKKVGIPTGSVSEDGLRRAIPDVQIMGFESYGDLMTALESGTIDAIASDEPAIRTLQKEMSKLRTVPGSYYEAPNGFVFAKTDRGTRLKEQMDTFLMDAQTAGTLTQLQQKWLTGVFPDEPVDLSGLAGNSPVLHVATDGETVPFSFVSGGAMAGYESELLALFCQRYGYGLEFDIMVFGSIIPSVTSGICDLGTSSISITDERQEIVLFSQPTVQVRYVAAMLDSAQTSSSFTTLAQLNQPGIRLGVQTGTIFDRLTAERFPMAQTQMFNSASDMLQCVITNKLDGFILDKLFAENMILENPGIAILPEIVTPDSYGFAFPKTAEGDRMCAEMNEFLARYRQNGQLEAIKDKWLADQNTPMPDTSGLTGERGSILLALESNSPPCCFGRNGEVVGLDMELIIHFCQEYGYDFSYMDMSFDAVIPSLNGVCNMAACGISITEERKEQVNLSDPYYNGGVVMMVRNLQEQPQEESFLSSLKTSFEKTFFRESRWKLILNGIGVTVKISLLTAFFGTALGFGLCLLRRLNRKWVNALIMTYVRILQGTPVVVLLMILFYVVFAKSKISGQMVAVIAFSLNFAAYVSEIMRAGIESIDRGQTEAALALGYTKMQAFFRIVMPQAAMQFLPVYKGEFISLVKTTSIVGYIAVQDLTKASDIIRSRTYEAFFPLIATAIIYFLISNLLTAALSAVELKIRPNRNMRSVKGVIEKGANHA